MGETLPDDFERMWTDLAEVGRSTSSGGYFRQPFASAERECHTWFCEQATARGLRLEHDGNGNTVAWWDAGEGDAVLTGSHLDSVLDGGAYDGPLGVVSALADPDDWLTGMMRAPVVIVPCSSKAAYLKRYAEDDKGWADEAESRWPMPFWHMDTAMAALLILQTCVDEGLGACYFGIPPERVAAVRTEFGIDPAFDPVGVITLGHRVPDTGNAGSPARRRRKPIDDVVHRGGWART